MCLETNAYSIEKIETVRAKHAIDLKNLEGEEVSINKGERVLALLVTTFNTSFFVIKKRDKGLCFLPSTLCQGNFTNFTMSI